MTYDIDVLMGHVKLDGQWMGSGWKVDGKWRGSGGEVDGKWRGSGGEVDGKWMGSGWEVAGGWESATRRFLLNCLPFGILYSV
jgi:hypothetical protein